jgi:hypothetical protein
MLKAKAGDRCFKCLSPGHRIDACRDPPRCILCFRFGHKARWCRSAPSSVASRPTPAAAPHARSTAPRPLPVHPTVAAPLHPPATAAAAPSQPSAAADLSAAAAVSAASMEEAALVLRAGHVRVGVARTEAIRRAERALELLRTRSVLVVDG